MAWNLSPQSWGMGIFGEKVLLKQRCDWRLSHNAAQWEWQNFNKAWEYPASKEVLGHSLDTINTRRTGTVNLTTAPKFTWNYSSLAYFLILYFWNVQCVNNSDCGYYGRKWKHHRPLIVGFSRVEVYEKNWWAVKMASGPTSVKSFLFLVELFSLPFWCHTGLSR